MKDPAKYLWWSFFSFFYLTELRLVCQQYAINITECYQVSFKLPESAKKRLKNVIAWSQFREYGPKRYSGWLFFCELTNWCHSSKNWILRKWRTMAKIFSRQNFCEYGYWNFHFIFCGNVTRSFIFITYFIFMLYVLLQIYHINLIV